MSERICGVVIPDFTLPSDRLPVLEGIFEAAAIERRTLPDGDPADLFDRLHRASEGFDRVVFGFADAPWYDRHEVTRLLKEVEEWDADYGFGENFPDGVVPETIRREALPVFSNLRRQYGIAPSRRLARDVFEKDVNLFDVENLWAPVNLRTFRLRFFPDAPNERRQLAWMGSLVTPEEYAKEGFALLARRLLDRRAELRFLPACVEIELLNRCSQRCVFCPKTSLPEAPEARMSRRALAGIRSQLRAMGASPVLLFGGLGDPALHPEFESLVSESLADGFEVVVETSGADLDEASADRFDRMPGSERLKTIFAFDAADESLYVKLRPGTRPFGEIRRVIEKHVLLRPKHTWVQAVKMIENVDHLVEWNRSWERFGAQTLIQKYDPFRGLLPERRLFPRGPLDVIDCWRLKRDLVIRADGRVPVCPEDVKGEHLLGNAIEDGVAAVWERGASHLARHVAGWDFCKSCDENYSFRF